MWGAGDQQLMENDTVGSVIPSCRSRFAGSEYRCPGVVAEHRQADPLSFDLDFRTDVLLRVSGLD